MSQHGARQEKEIVPLLLAADNAYEEKDYRKYGNSFLAMGSKPTEVISYFFQKLDELLTHEEKIEQKEKILANAQRLLGYIIESDRENNLLPNFSDYIHPTLKTGLLEDIIRCRKSMKKIKGRRETVWPFFEELAKHQTQNKLKNEQFHSIAKASFKDSTDRIDVSETLHQLASSKTKPEDIEELASKITQDLFNIATLKFKAIPMTDFLGTAWIKNQNTLKQAMLYYDKLSHVVINDLLKATTNIQRKNTLLLYANILKKSYENHDFTTFMAIGSALNSQALSFAKEVPEFNAIFEPFKPIFTDLSLQKLRKEIDESPRPLIPYIGIFTKDYTSVDEAASNDNTGHYNQVKVKHFDTFYTYQSKLNIDTAFSLQTNMHHKIESTRYNLDEEFKLGQSLFREIKFNEDPSLNSIIEKLCTPSQKGNAIQAYSVKVPESLAFIIDGTKYSTKESYLLILDLIRKQDYSSLSQKIAAYRILHDLERNITTTYPSSNSLKTALNKAKEKFDDDKALLIDMRVLTSLHENYLPVFLELHELNTQLNVTQNKLSDLKTRIRSLDETSAAQFMPEIIAHETHFTELLNKIQTNESQLSTLKKTISTLQKKYASHAETNSGITNVTTLLSTLNNLAIAIVELNALIKKQENADNNARTLLTLRHEIYLNEIKRKSLLKDRHPILESAEKKLMEIHANTYQALFLSEIEKEVSYQLIMGRKNVQNVSIGSSFEFTDHDFSEFAKTFLKDTTPDKAIDEFIKSMSAAINSTDPTGDPKEDKIKNAIKLLQNIISTHPSIVTHFAKHRNTIISELGQDNGERLGLFPALSLATTRVPIIRPSHSTNPPIDASTLLTSTTPSLNISDYVDALQSAGIPVQARQLNVDPKIEEYEIISTVPPEDNHHIPKVYVQHEKEEGTENTYRTSFNAHSNEPHQHSNDNAIKAIVVLALAHAQKTGQNECKITSNGNEEVAIELCAQLMKNNIMPSLQKKEFSDERVRDAIIAKALERAKELPTPTTRSTVPSPRPRRNTSS